MHRIGNLIDSITYYNYYKLLYKDLNLHIYNLDLTECYYSNGQIDKENIKKGIDNVVFSKKIYSMKTKNQGYLITVPILNNNGTIVGIVAILIKCTYKEMHLWTIIGEQISIICSFLLNYIEIKHPKPFESLTEREIAVLNKLLLGIIDDKIAKQLNISKPTVRKHLQSIYEKYSVSSKLELVCKYYIKESSSLDSLHNEKRRDLIC